MTVPATTWSQRAGSNCRPAVYETAALPLSYVGPPSHCSTVFPGSPRKAQAAAIFRLHHDPSVPTVQGRCPRCSDAATGSRPSDLQARTISRGCLLLWLTSVGPPRVQRTACTAAFAGQHVQAQKIQSTITEDNVGYSFLDTLAALLLPFRYTICHCSPCRAGCAALVLPMRKPS